MGSIIRKVIFFAVIIFFSLLLIGVQIGFFNKTQPIIEKSDTKLDTVATQLNNSEFKKYDGTTISGSDVISLINTKASSNLTIKVKTNSNPSGKSYNSGSYNLKDIYDVNYIEEQAQFDSVLVDTSNGTVTGITVTEQ